MSEQLNMSISPQIDVTQYKGLSHFTRRQISVAPSNLSQYVSSASTGDIFFDLPSAQRSLLNGEASYLTFTLNALGVAATTAASVSNGNAGSLIRVLEETIQNQTISTCNNYNVYANMIYDLQSKGRQTQIQSMLSGGGAAAKTGASLGVVNANIGTAPIRVCIPLHSAVFGTGQSNFLPCVDGMRLRLGMCPTDDALTCTVAGCASYTMTNISLKLEYLDMTDAVYRQLLDEANGVFKCAGSSVANFQTATTASATQSILIPARFSSIKALLVAFRLSADVAAPALKNAVGARCNPKVNTYTFNVDGRNLNPTPVIVNGGAGESVGEVMNCFNAVSSNQFDIAGDATTWLEDASTATGCFMIGMNFEEHSVSGQVVAGIDTNSSNVYLNMTNTAAAGGYTIDTFAIYDTILAIDMVNGSISLSK